MVTATSPPRGRADGLVEDLQKATRAALETSTELQEPVFAPEGSSMEAASRHTAEHIEAAELARVARDPKPPQPEEGPSEAIAATEPHVALRLFAHDVRRLKPSVRTHFKRWKLRELCWTSSAVPTDNNNVTADDIKKFSNLRFRIIEKRLKNLMDLQLRGEITASLQARCSAVSLY